MSDKNEDFRHKISELLSNIKSKSKYEKTINTISSVLTEIIEDNENNQIEESKNNHICYEINNDFIFLLKYYLLLLTKVSSFKIN